VIAKAGIFPGDLAGLQEYYSVLLLTYLMLRLIHDESYLEASLRRNRCEGWLALWVVWESQRTICLHTSIFAALDIAPSLAIGR
jgi:hypothetical protein